MVPVLPVPVLVLPCVPVLLCDPVVLEALEPVEPDPELLDEP